jgi:hypothetical protein
MQETYYLNNVYPFQDEVLKVVQDLNVDFYLTGGTVLSRCYLQHRYSDDLDFFVNNYPEFKLQCTKVVSLLKKFPWKCEVTTTSETFVRIMLEKDRIPMKIDLVNDVFFHYGNFEQSQIYHRIDNWRNILSNKLCALSRLEPKDIADILFIAKRYPFNWEDIFMEAREKDLWVEPLEVCRIIINFPVELFGGIKWSSAVNINSIKEDLIKLHDDIFYGNENCLCKH